MCGFAGVLSPFQSNPEVLGRALSNMLAHRGPDGEGMWSDPDGGVLLVHRRLAILDTTNAGEQPMRPQKGSDTNGTYLSANVLI